MRFRDDGGWWRRTKQLVTPLEAEQQCKFIYDIDPDESKCEDITGYWVRGAALGRLLVDWAFGKRPGCACVLIDGLGRPYANRRGNNPDEASVH